MKWNKQTRCANIGSKRNNCTHIIPHRGSGFVVNKRERIIVKYENICQICGKETDVTKYKDYPELDHKIPRSMGGTNAEENLALVCNDCNNKKSNIYGWQRFNKIRNSIRESFTTFDSNVIDYELKNGIISKGDLNILLIDLEKEFDRIRKLVNDLKEGNENG